MFVIEVVGEGERSVERLSREELERELMILLF